MELPQLTPAQIDEALKGTEYGGALNQLLGKVCDDWWNDAVDAANRDATLNAARAILLARENERLRGALNEICSEAALIVATKKRAGPLDVIIHKARQALAQTETQGKTE